MEYLNQTLGLSSDGTVLLTLLIMTSLICYKLLSNNIKLRTNNDILKLRLCEHITHEIKLKFKAYSLQNRDSEEVYKTKRLRDCEPGNPILVFGSSVMDSEYELKKLRDSMSVSPNIIIQDIKCGSFTAVIKSFDSYSNEDKCSNIFPPTQRKPPQPRKPTMPPKKPIAPTPRYVTKDLL